MNMIDRYDTGFGSDHMGPFGPWMAIFALIIWLAVTVDLVLLGILLYKKVKKTK